MRSTPHIKSSPLPCRRSFLLGTAARSSSPISHLEAQFNAVRNMPGYTGTYRKTRCPSAGRV